MTAELSQAAPGGASLAVSAADRPEFSVIITCYYEEQSIREFHSRLTTAMQRTGRSFEIVMVNDGSTDRTFEKLCAIFNEDVHVSAVVDLFCNTGQVCAMSAGIAHGRGEHFVFMDSDLQLDPEELPLLLESFDSGYDIVSGCRAQRRDAISRRISSLVANWIMRRVSGHSLTDFGCTFKIYDGRLVRAFDFGPYRPWRTAYVFAHAQNVKEIPITHRARKYGKSGWTFRKLSEFLMDHAVGMSKRPFQLISAACMLVGAALALRIALSYIVDFSVLPTITPGFQLNTLLVGFLLTLGVLTLIGEYVIRNFGILQNDPIYVVRTRFQKAPTPADSVVSSVASAGPRVPRA